MIQVQKVTHISTTIGKHTREVDPANMLLSDWETRHHSFRQVDISTTADANTRKYTYVNAGVKAGIEYEVWKTLTVKWQEA